MSDANRQLNHPLPVDPLVRSVADIMLDRSAVGQQKYGTTLAGNHAPVLDRINHRQQESLDAALYDEWLKPFAAALDLLIDPAALPHVLRGLSIARSDAADTDLRAAMKIDDAIASLLKLAPAEAGAA
jgi:hypothetical protein